MPSARHLLALLLAGLPSAVAAIDLIPDIFGSDEENGRTVWEAGKQYIRLVGREEGATPNQHPVTLPVAQVARALAALEVKEGGGLLAQEGEPAPLFVASEVADLSANIARALSTATPEEELVFVVIGLHQGTFAKERMAVGGRVFHAGDRLHIIFGDVQKPMKVAANKQAVVTGETSTDIDLRLEPIKVGHRDDEQEQKNPISGPEGFELMKDTRGVPRSDWVVLDVPRLVAALEAKKNALPEGVAQERAKMRLEAQKAAQERRQMREEMARLRKEMKAGGASSPEERLSRLEDLRDKALISPEEYERKREEILREL